MGITATLVEWVFTGSNPEVIHECRACGTTLSADIATCHVCDSTEVAEYSVD